MTKYLRLKLRHLFKSLVVAFIFNSVFHSAAYGGATTSSRASAASGATTNQEDRNLEQARIRAEENKITDKSAEFILSSKQEIKALQDKSLQTPLTLNEQKRLDDLARKIQLVKFILSGSPARRSAKPESAKPALTETPPKTSSR